MNQQAILSNPSFIFFKLCSGIETTLCCEGNVEKQTAELRKQLATVQSELENSMRRRDEAVKNEQLAIEDLKQQVLCQKSEYPNTGYFRLGVSTNSLM